jgi:hypothetical protein
MLYNDKSTEIITPEWTQFDQSSLSDLSLPLGFGNCAQTIDIRHSEISVNDSFFSILPPSLIRLNLDSAHLVTDCGVQQLQTCYNLLSLSLTNSRQVTGAVFKDLPRSLTTLELTSLTRVVDAQIVELPRTLVYLDIRKAAELTNACGPWIPPTLITWHMFENKQITGDIITLVPLPARSKLTLQAASVAFFNGVRRS